MTSAHDFSFVFSAVMFRGLVAYILLPVTPVILDIVSPRNETRIRVLAFDVDYGVDMQIYWIWLWLHTSMAVAVFLLNLIATDLMFITFNVHACYLYAVVK